VRTGFTVAQVTAPMAQWAAKNKIKTVVTLVRLRSRAWMPRRCSSRTSPKAAARCVDSAARPLRNPDYAPFLARVKDAKPDALFVFVPSGEGARC
jgi:branched-chain amino acid transport system substrate-binding protein